jgi:acetyl esterase/lipase
MSFQKLIAGMMMRLPAGLLVKLSGGKPLTIEGRTLEPQLQAVAWNGRKAPPLSSLSPEIVQAATIEQIGLMAAKPEPGVTFDDIMIPGKGGHEIRARTYRPIDQDPNAPLMVYYHMGGGVILDIESCHAFCTIIASIAKCPVVSVDYRLAPQHKFPAGIEDCIAAYEWALRNAGDYGAPEGVAAVGGDSMGGNFSAIIAQEMMREHKPLPALQLLIYPAVDLVENFPSRTAFADTFSLSTDTMNWFMEQYLPEGFDQSNPMLSPGQTRDLSGLPPAIVVTAGHDPLVDEGDNYAKRLESDGVEVIHKCYDTLSHAFTAFTDFSPGSRAACVEIAGFVRDMYSRR